MNSKGYKNLSIALLLSAINSGDVEFFYTKLGEACCIIADIPVELALLTSVKKTEQAPKKKYLVNNELFNLSELSRKLNLSPSTVHRYLKYKKLTAQELADARMKNLFNI